MAVRDDFSAGEVLTAADLNDTFSSKLDLAGGKIVQIVRATDSTDRTTTSTTFVDVPGMSVTISPTYATSAVIVISSFYCITFGTTVALAEFQLTDASDTPLSGAEKMVVAVTDAVTQYNPTVLIGYATPATTSATTYKLRYLRNANTASVRTRNTASTGQMYAIEVSA